MSFIGPILYQEGGLSPPLGASDFLCPMTNISQCSFTESADAAIMMIYNPLLPSFQNRKFRIPVKDTRVRIFDSAGQELKVQFMPVMEEVKQIPGRDSEAEYDAWFQVPELMPMGYNSFYIQKSGPEQPEKVNNAREILIPYYGFIYRLAKWSRNQKSPITFRSKRKMQ